MSCPAPCSSCPRICCPCVSFLSPPTSVMVQHGQAPAAHSSQGHTARPTSHPVTTVRVMPRQWPWVTGVFPHAFCSRCCPLLTGFHGYLRKDIFPVTWVSTHMSNYTYWQSSHVYEIWDKACRSIIYCYSKVASLSCNLPFPSSLMSTGKERSWGWSEAACKVRNDRQISIRN